MSFGNFNNDDSHPPMQEINVTPLVDVMLVLLIVFMVTMPLITHSIPLNLPEVNSKAVDTQEEKKPVRVAINEQGTFYLGDKKVSEQELGAVFQRTFQSDRNTIISIAADKTVSYKYVVKMLTLAQTAGLTKVGFVTEAD